MAQLMPLPLIVSCFIKIQIGGTFPVPLTRVVPDKGPLNGCVCVCVVMRMTLITVPQHKHPMLCAGGENGFTVWHSSAHWLLL